MNEHTTPQTTPDPQKKAYVRPQLQVHGTVAELTEIGGVGSADKSQGSVADL